MTPQPRPGAIFLDRDGTINVDPGYLDHPSKLALLPEVPEALAELKRAGFRLVVVSNQSGVGRGLIRPEMLSEIHVRLDEMISSSGARIDHYELCIHHPDDHCECRKPKTKLFEDAAKKLGIDLSASYMIGDKLSDLKAGRNAGCKGTALVRTGSGRETEGMLNSEHPEADFIGDGLSSVSEWILSQET